MSKSLLSEAFSKCMEEGRLERKPSVRNSLKQFAPELISNWFTKQVLSSSIDSERDLEISMCFKELWRFQFLFSLRALVSS